MPETYIPVFEIYSKEKINEVEKAMNEKLNTIEKVISNIEPNQSKDPKRWFLFSHILYPIVTKYYHAYRFPDMEKSFFADERCNGCGICQKICLSEKIHINDKLPKWNSSIRCTYCFACIHFCPEKAIQLRGRKTQIRGRYHHPEITANDIMKQKAYNQ